MKKLKNLLLVSIVMIGVATLTACDKKEENKDPLIGTWEYNDNYMIATFVFEENGKGTYTLSSGDNKSTLEIKYEKDDKNISITYGDATVPFETTYKIEDDTFIMLDSLKNEVKYKKK